MKQPDAEYWIKQLSLQPHPEGGYYKEVFRSQQQVNRLGEGKALQACTSIYYLLEGEDYSGFHKISSDEIWYFHQGVPLMVHVITAQGKHEAWTLSDQPGGGLSLVVPAGLWFAAEIPSKAGFALVSCAVAPGFEFSEFEMAKKEELIETYPGNEGLIGRLCR
ncbi:cupin domain-containing protein [Mucilaginibacter psychrotolerans]|uniref:Cupin domain-containing protein n=1 Tax=Mucilaginibacter psychrotolerans TaxID=1524096 RepID=A0A4Y8SDC0_9SPHI|nr:cupin domain-containing protein [Mucilaginibacter psychrotolerans]TFF36356.1 cupin domain-containing protein [Mucilaginibacter psychrotolerans]